MMLEDFERQDRIESPLRRDGISTPARTLIGNTLQLHARCRIEFRSGFPA
ncbi:hypothetical protein [Burkholderia sp. FL-7-2-10-S1-D7]|nr:hypothetical protein [Burkholderia sp. FL-7-2-10-S1-D7]